VIRNFVPAPSTFVIPFYYGSGTVLITVPVLLRSVIKLRFRKKLRFLRFRFRNTVHLCSKPVAKVAKQRNWRSAC